MHKDCAALFQLYQYLDRYYQQSAQAAVPDKTVLIAEQLAGEFCKLADLQPQLLRSQLALTPAAQSLTSQLAIKQAVLLHNIAKAAKWPDIITEELIACCFFRLTAVHQPLQQAENSIVELLQQAGLFSLKLAGNSFTHRQWRRLLHDSSLSSSQKPLWQQSPYASAIRFCSQISAQITPAQHQVAVGLETALQRLLQKPYQPLDLHFVNLLAQDKGQLHLTGRFCSDGIGEVALITEVTPELKAYALDLSTKQLKSQPSQLYDSGMKLLSPARLADASWLELFVSSPAVSAAEPLLTLSELYLLNPQHSVKQQVAWLESQPKLATTLCHQARQLSRQQLPIRDLTHAVALVGADNLPLLLRLGWLAQHQHSCRQPYATWFYQLQQCLAASFTVLAKASSQLELLPLQAQLLAGCFCLVLMQEDNCRWYPLQQSNQTVPLALFSHQTSWQQTEFPRQVSQLVASLGFHRLWQDAVLSYRQPLEMQAAYSHQQSANALIQLGWILAESVFYQPDLLGTQWQQQQKSAVKALDLPNMSWAIWQQSVLEQHNCYWPLQPDL